MRELGVAEGFSTITMQVVRNAFIPELANERTLRRKLIEISLAKRCTAINIHFYAPSSTAMTG